MYNIFIIPAALLRAIKPSPELLDNPTIVNIELRCLAYRYMRYAGMVCKEPWVFRSRASITTDTRRVHLDLDEEKNSLARA